MIGVLAAAVAKKLVFKSDTVYRDRALPVIVFVSNLIAELVRGLLAGAVAPATAAPVALLASAAWLGGLGELLRYPAAAFADTLLSFGVHRLKKFLDALLAPPKPK